MRLLIGLLGAALLVGTPMWSNAGQVNCKQVKKYLDTGRSVKDVAETMVIDEDEVKKCQEQAGAGGETKGADTQGGGGAKTGEQATCPHARGGRAAAPRDSRGRRALDARGARCGGRGGAARRDSGRGRGRPR